MKRMIIEKALTKYIFKFSFKPNSLWYSREIRMRLAVKKKTGPLLQRLANSLRYSREIKMRLAEEEKTGHLLSDASYTQLIINLKTFLGRGIINWERKKYKTLKTKKSSEDNIKADHNA